MWAISHNIIIGLQQNTSGCLTVPERSSFSPTCLHVSIHMTAADEWVLMEISLRRSHYSKLVNTPDHFTGGKTSPRWCVWLAVFTLEHIRWDMSPTEDNASRRSRFHLSKKHALSSVSCLLSDSLQSDSWLLPNMAKVKASIWETYSPQSERPLQNMSHVCLQHHFIFHSSLMFMCSFILEQSLTKKICNLLQVALSFIVIHSVTVLEVYPWHRWPCCLQA